MYGGKNIYKNKLRVDTKLFNLKLNNSVINKYITKNTSKKNYFWSTLSKKK